MAAVAGGTRSPSGTGDGTTVLTAGTPGAAELGMARKPT